MENFEYQTDESELCSVGSGELLKTLEPQNDVIDHIYKYLHIYTPSMYNCTHIHIYVFDRHIYLTRINILFLSKSSRETCYRILVL